MHDTIPEKVAFMSTPGITIEAAEETLYDFAYDKDAWTPVVVSPIRTKPAETKPAETRIFLQDAYVTLHTTIHRPLDSSGSRRSRRIRRPLAVASASVLLVCLLLAAAVFAARWFVASHGDSVQCQVSAFVSSVTRLAQGQQDSPSFHDVFFTCMNASDGGVSLAERRR